MVMSVHRYDQGKFFPYLETGNLEFAGKGNGLGYNVNIPWNTGSGEEEDSIIGDGEYRAAFDEIMYPIARKFDPDLVLVSCGFDAMAGDPEGHCSASQNIYGYMTQSLMGLA